MGKAMIADVNKNLSSVLLQDDSEELVISVLTRPERYVLDGLIHGKTLTDISNAGKLDDLQVKACYNRLLKILHLGQWFN